MGVLAKETWILIFQYVYWSTVESLGLASWSWRVAQQDLVKHNPVFRENMQHNSDFQKNGHDNSLLATLTGLANMAPSGTFSTAAVSWMVKVRTAQDLSVALNNTNLSGKIICIQGGEDTEFIVDMKPRSAVAVAARGGVLVNVKGEDSAIILLDGTQANVYGY